MVRVCSDQNASTLLITSTALNALAAMKLDGPSADVFSTPDQLDSEMLTLTLLPRARWQTLLNLDVIQVGSSTTIQTVF